MSKKYFNDLGPLEALLGDPDIIEIMVNRYDRIYIDKHGQVTLIAEQFQDEDHLMQVIRAIAEPMGRKVDESHPIVDLRLPDGSRMHIVIPPIATQGATFNIRKFTGNTLSAEALIEFGAWSRPMVELLTACVRSRFNIVVAGGTGSGKTTTFNILVNMIPDEERLIVMENAGELRVTKPHAITLETRPANLEGQGEVTMQFLVESAMKMRPDRLIMSEALKGGEVSAMLAAMNTGLDGSMFTLHANNARDTLARLEVMMLEANPSMPVLAVREHIAAAIDVIISQQRLRDGTRRMLAITELAYLQGGEFVLNDIFQFHQTDVEQGQTAGIFRPTGNTPHFLPQLEEAGFSFPASFFNAS